jgi:hypothetical protein
MDTCAQPLLGGHSLQQLVQLAPLGHVEPAQQVALGIPTDAFELGHNDLTVSCEVQRMHSTVAAAPSTLDEAALLEIVEEHDHSAGWGTELLGDGLLATTRMLGHGSEHADVGRGDTEWRHLLREPRGGMGTELGQQECRTHERRPLFTHSSTIWLAESFCS